MKTLLLLIAILPYWSFNSTISSWITQPPTPTVENIEAAQLEFIKQQYPDTPKPYQVALNYAQQHQLVRVKEGDYYALMQLSNTLPIKVDKIVVDFDRTYTEIRSFITCGWAIIESYNSYNLIDADGNEVLSLADCCSQISEINNNYYKIKDHYDYWTLIDCKGEVLIEGCDKLEDIKMNNRGNVTAPVITGMQCDNVFVSLAPPPSMEPPKPELPKPEPPKPEPPKPELPKPTLSPKVNGDLYVLAIGISNFIHHPGLDLFYADKDARDISDVLLLQGAEIFDSIHIDTLLNYDATKANIIAKLDYIKNEVETNDYVFLQISTHGVIQNEVYYLKPTDIRINQNKIVPETAIEGTFLEQTMHNIPCNVILALDACHSGKFVADRWRGSYQVEEERTRGGFPSADTPKINLLSEPIMELGFNVVSNSSTVALPKNLTKCILASSLEAQKSRESGKWKNGILTEAILAAFNNETLRIENVPISPDYNDIYGKNILTIQELYNYVSKKISILGKTKQQSDITIRGRGDVPFFHIK